MLLENGRRERHVQLCWTLPKVCLCLRVLLEARAGVGEGGGKMPGLEEGALAANTNHCPGDATVLL